MNTHMQETDALHFALMEWRIRLDERGTVPDDGSYPAMYDRHCEIVREHAEIVTVSLTVKVGGDQ